MASPASPAALTSAPVGLPGDDVADRRTVAQIRRGNREAFERVYRAYYSALVGFVYNYVHSETTAEEEVQEIFLALWRRRQEWELRTTLRAYLFQSARNRALNRLKHDSIVQATFEEATAGERRLAVGESPVDLHEQLEASELASAARRAVDRLPARCRAAFDLVRSHGLSYAEAAHVMGISEHTVKIQMTRALKAIRVALAPWLA